MGHEAQLARRARLHVVTFRFAQFLAPLEGAWLTSCPGVGQSAFCAGEGCRAATGAVGEGLEVLGVAAVGGTDQVAVGAYQ
ncbi:hypothetical protein P3T39_004681 [Kitasatospora sp. GP82]|nr:hypothetical protein [Kitasatospora sp. GP82]